MPPCPGGKVCWYRVRKASVADIDEARTTPNRVTIQCQTLGESGWEAGASLVLTNDDIDHYIIAEATCPDPSSPDGFGEPSIIGITEPAEPDIYSYTYVRWTGTITPATGAAYQLTTPFAMFFAGVVAIRGLWGCGQDIEYQQNDAASFETTVPPVGAVSPWRASVITTNKTTNPTGVYALGGFASPCFGSGPGSQIPGTAFGGTVEGRVISVVGNWEFSNNGVDVITQWEGTTGNEQGP